MLNTHAKILIRLAATCLLAGAGIAADWPMFGCDPARSAATAESLEFPLRKLWAYEPAQPPRPAWPEPGKELHRIDFDYAFQPVAAGGLVYFGSSADDTVRALNAATGECVWRFTTAGPIRFAPAIAGGRAYVASDDGRLYCLDAATGATIWAFRAGPEDRQLLGNGRLISRWPLRSGVLVDGAVVYATAGMWPTQGVYVFALDADTGRQLWCNDGSGNIFINLPHCGSSGFDGVAPQGCLALAGDTLLVPTGRSVPAAFDRRTGRRLYYRPAISTKDGGAWVAAAGGFYLNPANPSWWCSQASVGEAQPRSRDGMCVYALATGDLRAKRSNEYRVLAADGRLYGATVDKAIQACEWDASHGLPATSPLWRVEHPRVYSFALAGDALLAGGAGAVTAFGAGNGKLLWRSEVEGQVRGIAVASGRVLAASSTGAVVCFGPGAGDGSATSRVKDAAPPAPLPKAFRVKAAAIVQRTGALRGYALVAGAPDSRLAEALAAETELHVVSLLRDPGAVQAERRRLTASGRYGDGVVVHGTGDPAALSLPSYFARLVVVTGDPRGLSGKELYRTLRPCGGKLVFFGVGKDLAGELLNQAGAPGREISADRLMVERGPLPGAGEWRCQWADPGRTGASGETRLRRPLEPLWFGGPGPDRMMDRSSGGAGSPLSVNGAVFVTGEHSVVAFDAYTGQELWVREIQQAGRMGAKYASANFAADDDSLYLAIGHECLRLDQTTGKTLATYRVPAALAENKALPPGFLEEDRHKAGTNEDSPAHMGWGWGCVVAVGDVVLGSHRLPKRYAEKIQGYVPWWEPRYSVALFAVNKGTGKTLWTHRARRGVSGADIACGGGKAFFIDATPEPDVYGSAKRRGAETRIERSLIALNLADGAELWRHDDLPDLPRTWTTHLQFAEGVVVVGANVAYDADTGAELWRHTLSPRRPPVIQGPWIIDMSTAHHLRTGQPRLARDTLTGRECKWRFLRSRGCGNIVGSQSLLFFRAGCYGLFDSDNEIFTTFGGGRPNCGIGMIAANGLVIAPETSSGCSCSFNYQTSLALIPGRDRGDSWGVFPHLDDTAASQEIKTLRLNLGAPGDRADGDGLRWIGFPQLGIRSQTRAPAMATVVMENPEWRHQPSTAPLMKGTDKPWLYTCALAGNGRIHLDTVLTGRGVRGVVVPECAAPPEIDGDLGDACWQGAEPVPFAGDAHLAEPGVTLYIRRNAAGVYFAYRRKAVLRNGRPAPFVGGHTEHDAPCWEDDDFEVMVTNRNRGKACHFGVNCAGARFDGFVKRISAERRPDYRWNGEWKAAVKRGQDEWTAEIEIPLATLKEAQIETAGDRNLRLNCLSRNVSGHGVAKAFLIDPDLEFHRGRNYLAAIDKPTPTPSGRLFTVRLHFVESRDVSPGARVFDVLLQGEPALQGFDVVREAGGRHTPVVREFRDVRARQSLVVETASAPGKLKPVISAIEMIETGRVPKLPDAVRPEADAHTVSLLHLDEQQGTTAADASANGLNAELEPSPNNPEWRPHGRFGGCLELDGDNPDGNGDEKGDADGLNWADGAGPVANAAGFTLELWVKHKHLNGWQFYILRRGGGMNYGFVAKKDRLYVGFKPAGGEWVEVWSDACLRAGEWHHIAFTYDREQVRIYCDGDLRGATPVKGELGQGKGYALIGHDSDRRPSQIRGFCGLMDEIRVSNVARTNFP